jgi:hypothetical protein
MRKWGCGFTDDAAARRTRWARRLRWLVIVAVSPWSVLCGGWAQTPDAQQVEAAFLFHFAQLVDWPPETLKNPGNAFSVCIFGDEPLQSALQETVAGKLVGDQSIRVLPLSVPQEAQACQIVFIGRTQGKVVAALVSALHSAPVLTVGETADFLAAGGMIQFVMEGNKVRFEINLNAAQAAKLKIGSRLLVLAQHVTGDPHGN